ncbi:MAG: LptF/LptG family permease, partial [Nitrospinae bacterium]|nr:LptF/LptG family permease [Nitrospinota bacterium]
TGRNPETMNYQELGRYIENLRKSGANPTRYIVDMWAKISAPFISFVLAIVGVAFSIRSSRSGGAALGVAIAIAIGAIYLVLFHASLSFGHAGRLPPILAAWGPNAIFLAGGAYFLASIKG